MFVIMMILVFYSSEKELFGIRLVFMHKCLNTVFLFRPDLLH